MKRRLTRKRLKDDGLLLEQVRRLQVKPDDLASLS